MPHVAVLIPCLNEEKTIARVIQDFRRELPQASIHVFDNNSTDQTVAEATGAGAIVHSEPERGKGNVVRSMFRKVVADVHVMVDGDDTYPAEAVHQLIEPILRGEADMVVGSRFLAADSEFRLLNRAGNQFFLWLINTLFHGKLTDMMSGLRAMSSEFVETVDVAVPGFEVEVEMTIKALQKGLRIRETSAVLRPRPEGSFSKLRRFRDGFRILRTVISLLRDYRPLLFFSAAGVAWSALALLPMAVGMIAASTAGAGLLTWCSIAATVVWMMVGGCLAVGMGTEVVNRRLRELEQVVRKNETSRAALERDGRKGDWLKAS
jgi:glycosyltransferase involved in cell wall biosynthesis